MKKIAKGALPKNKIIDIPQPTTLIEICRRPNTHSFSNSSLVTLLAQRLCVVWVSNTVFAPPPPTCTFLDKMPQGEEEAQRGAGLWGEGRDKGGRQRANQGPLLALAQNCALMHNLLGPACIFLRKGPTDSRQVVRRSGLKHTYFNAVNNWNTFHTW